MSPGVLSSRSQSSLPTPSIQSQPRRKRTDPGPSRSNSRAESNNENSNYLANDDLVLSQVQSSHILPLVGHVLEELVTTERSYCRSLYVFSEVVAKTVCTKTGVSLKDLRLLFPRCLPELYSMHVKLLYRLDLGMATLNQETISVHNSINADGPAFPVSALLRTLTEPIADSQLGPKDTLHGEEPSTVFFSLYKHYLTQFTVAMETMRRLLRQSSKFRHTLKGLERHADCEGSDFSGFLLAPVQRLPRYLLLMKQLVRHLTKLPDTSPPIGGIPVSEALEHARQAETHLHTILVHLDAQVSNCLPNPPDIPPNPSTDLKSSPVPVTTGDQMSPRKLTQVHSARISATRDTAKCFWPRIRRAFSEIQDKSSTSADHPTQPLPLTANASGDVMERTEIIDKPSLGSSAVPHDSNESVHIFSITEEDGRSNASFQLVEVNLAESATPYSEGSKTPDKQMVHMHEDPLNLTNLPALHDPHQTQTIEPQKDNVTPSYSHPGGQLMKSKPPTQSLLDSGTQTSPAAFTDDRPDCFRHLCSCSSLVNSSRDIRLRDHATLTDEHDVCLEQPITSNEFVPSLSNYTLSSVQRHRSMPTDPRVRGHKNFEGMLGAIHSERPISTLLVDCHKPIESQSSLNESSGVNCRIGDVHLECSTATAPKHIDHLTSARWLPSLTRSRHSSQLTQSARRVQWKDNTTGQLTTSEQACEGDRKTMDAMKFSLMNLFRRKTIGSEDISDWKDGTLHSSDLALQNEGENSDGQQQQTHSFTCEAHSETAPFHQPSQSLAFVDGTLVSLSLPDRLQLEMASSLNDLLVDNIEETVFLDETGHPCFQV
ncbi:unnamed protein product [Dicrocoelium dendriticum]|nr:unnamed protein product [Dicrocoelium dendriticum]